MLDLHGLMSAAVVVVQLVVELVVELLVLFHQ